MSMHLLSVSFRSCRSRFLVCGFWIPNTILSRMSDSLMHSQKLHVCESVRNATTYASKVFFWPLIPTLEHVKFVRFVGFANREFVAFFCDAFQLLPFLGVVKWHSIEDFQGFRSYAVEKKGDLIGLWLLVYVHDDCVVAPCLLEGFPVFCDILFYVEMSRWVDSLNRECYWCGARHASSSTCCCRL